MDAPALLARRRGGARGHHVLRCRGPPPAPLRRRAGPVEDRRGSPHRRLPRRHVGRRAARGLARDPLGRQADADDRARNARLLEPGVRVRRAHRAARRRALHPGNRRSLHVGGRNGLARVRRARGAPWRADRRCAQRRDRGRAARPGARRSGDGAQSRAGLQRRIGARGGARRVGMVDAGRRSRRTAPASARCCARCGGPP